MVEIEHNVANGSPPLRLFLKEAVLPSRNDMKMGHANLLHALALHCKYNKRFDSINYAAKKQTNCLFFRLTLFFLHWRSVEKKM